MDDSVRTKVVASAMPVAVSSRFETPMNGHRPRNFTSTKLFTSTALVRRRPRLSRFSVMASRQGEGRRKKGEETASPFYRLRFRLFHPHPRLRALIWLKDEDVLSARTGGEHHALGDAEAHLARRKVGDHHREAAFQRGGFVGALDAGEHVARLAADVQRQPQQLVGAFHWLGLDDARDAQVHPGEI